MVNELVFVAVVSTSGALLVASFDRSAAWHRIGFAGPMLGYAGYVLVSLPLVSLQSFSMWPAVIALLGISLLALWSRHGSHALQWGMAWGILLAATLSLLVVAGAYVLHATRLTPDSGTYLIVSGWLEETGGVSNASETILLKRQLGTPLLHVVGQGAGPGYAVGWTALLGASSIALLVTSSWTYLSRLGVTPRRLVILESLAVLLLLTTNRILYNFAYINSHMIFASLLFAAVLFAWLRPQEPGRSSWLLTGLALAALIPLRAESFIVVVLFAIPMIHSTRREPANAWALLAPVVYATLIWYGLTVYLTTGPGLETLGPLIVAITLCVYLLLIQFHLPGWSKVGLAALPVLLIGYLIVSGTSDLTMLSDTTQALGTNIFWKGRWGLFWIVTPVVLASVFVTKRVDRDLVFYYGLSTFALALVAFAFLRDGAYRVSQSDSGNRMLMHVVFVAAFYAVVGIGTSLRQRAVLQGCSQEPSTGITT